MQAEFKKIIKSKIIFNVILSVLVVSALYVFLLYSDIFQESASLDLGKLAMISHRFNGDIVYYFLPFVILYLINEYFAKDIQTGSLKFVMLREKRASVILAKLIMMILVSGFVLTITHVINFIIVPGITTRTITFEVFFVDLYFRELMIITLMILIFTPIAMIKNMNLIGLLIFHFIFIFIEKINPFIGRLIYSGQLFKLLHKGYIEWSIILVEFIILVILNMIIFERREFIE